MNINPQVMGMVWTSGVMGVFPSAENLRGALEDFSKTRIESNFPLRSIVQLNKYLENISKNVDVIQGTVINEYIRKTKKLEEVKKGVFRLIEGEPYVDIKFGIFWATTKSIIIVDRKDNAEFVFKVISEALSGDETFIRPVWVDIRKIADDYRGHWLGSIINRRGHMTTGTFYGSALEKDDVIGSEYLRCDKHQVGIITRYFGVPTKVKITKDGIINIYANIDRVNYIKFIRDELMDYIRPTEDIY